MSDQHSRSGPNKAVIAGKRSSDHQTTCNESQLGLVTKLAEQVQHPHRRSIQVWFKETSGAVIKAD
ncbi:hypothetical protein GCM10022276_06350 [Sphingomonas limnosediminicola]|uniref:Uncharacterized protein n=1 Tax=Sphingomonas limnosediminicola TaxID=940133 RepID=A0ABP7KXZ3_9SPHN